jgi:DNA-binding MarR family transcriptional regulator
MKQIIDRINKVFENKTRLGVMSALMVNESIDFISLRKLLGVTDGNLSSNISVLENLKLVRVKKKIIAKKTNTSYSITITGQKAFRAHLEALQSLIQELDH